MSNKIKQYDFMKMPVFENRDIEHSFNCRATLEAALQSRVQRGSISKIRAGLYVTIDSETGKPIADKFQIACKLRPDGCCAYYTALEYYGLVPESNLVQIAQSEQMQTVKALGMTYQTYSGDNSLGVNIVSQNPRVAVTDLERTVLDCLNRPALAGGLETIFEVLKKVTLNEKKLLKYLRFMGKKGLYKKAGSIFSLIDPSWLSEKFYRTCREHMPCRYDDYRTDKKGSYITIDKWMVKLPAFKGTKSCRAGNLTKKQGWRETQRRKRISDTAARC